MTLFYVGAALLVLALILFIVIPLFFYKRSGIKQRDVVSNPEIVKQRLVELESEKREALLTESDYRDAVTETKLHLAEELPDAESNENKTRSSLPGVAISSAMILTVGVLIYFQVNHIDDVANWESAQQRLPEMGQRIVVQADGSVSRQELMEFALALRTKLNTEKHDAVGWLLLGRVLSSVGDFEGAILAFNKSIGLEPGRTGTLFSLAQTLLLTSDENNVLRAESLLKHLKTLTPGDNNVLGLLAVMYSRKGQQQLAVQTWQELKSQLAPGDPMMATVDQQLAMLQPSTQPETSGTVINVNVTVSPELTQKVPANGYIFVFVQDADSEMKMPAAVKKQALTGLDWSGIMTFTLTNSDAMLQEFNLSNLKNGRLIARLSSDGNVAAENGDFQGEIVIPIQQGLRSEHKLIIDKELM